VADHEAEDEDASRYDAIAHEIEQRLEQGQTMVDEISNGKPCESTVDLVPEPSGMTLVDVEADVEGGDPGARTEADIPNEENPLHEGESAPSETKALDIVDLLDDVDDEELERYLCTPEEVTARTRMWVEFNKDYLEALAGGFYLRDNRASHADLSGILCYSQRCGRTDGYPAQEEASETFEAQRLFNSCGCNSSGCDKSAHAKKERHLATYQLRHCILFAHI
jgi:hypothetical protein